MHKDYTFAHTFAHAHARTILLLKDIDKSKSLCSHVLNRLSYIKDIMFQDIKINKIKVRNKIQTMRNQ